MKKYLIVVVVLFSIALLFGCNRKVTTENVVDKIGEKLKDVDSYHSEAVMTIHKEDETIKYDVTVDYMKPDYYKVNLVNQSNNNKQVILKNDEGVYILSPALNKSFKFQSDWPANSTNSYIYQMVMSSIIDDEERIVSDQGDNIKIESKLNTEISTKYDNQAIIVNKKSLLPVSVMMYDQKANPKLSITFTEFDFKAKHDKTEFQKDNAMNVAILELGEGFVSYVDRMISRPVVNIDNVDLEFETINADNAVMKYSGDKSFTLSQRFVSENELDLSLKEFDTMVLLENTMAAKDETSLMWLDNGIEYTIYSDSLNIDEMTDIANSIENVIV